MQASFNCPNCSNVLQAETTWSGQQTQCPYCKNMIVIPQFSATFPQGAVPPSPDAPMGYAPIIVQNKDFFMIRLFNSLFDSLRSISLFNILGKSKNILIKIGAIAYVVLGILLFIVSCIRSGDMSSAWAEIFKGMASMVGLVVFSVCGMYMFKLYDDIFAKGKPNSVPKAFLNTTAAVSLCACLYYIVWRISETCIADNGLAPLYKNLRLFMIYFPLLIVSLSPSVISISTEEQSTVDTAIGISFFAGKTALFIVPFVWFYDAAYRIVNMLIHLGADKSKFTEAYNISSNGLPEEIFYPVFVYIAYLLFDFVISAIKSFMDAKSNGQ